MQSAHGFRCLSASYWQAAGGPDHGAAVAAEGESGDNAEVALQDAHALAGAQVPQPDAAVLGGGEELQAVDVGVELHQAATTCRRDYS